jgi:thymidylate synthase
MPHPEQQYLDLIRKLLEHGFYRPSPHQPLPSQPNPPGTYSLRAERLIFDLSRGEFPLSTVRRTSLKAIIAELLWFISGSTSNGDLHDLGSHIWDSWDTPETNQSLGWDEGQLGPIYGKQWRHWGARMSKPSGELDYPGFDQLTHLVSEIKTNPNSKRLMVTSYDPIDAEDCFVTTCHGTFFCQVWGDRLHLTMVQRSGDVPIGIPFNIASYALLLMMLAQVTGLKPGELILDLMDAHLYENQIPAMKELLEREPLPCPRIEINPLVKRLEDFVAGDFTLIGYENQGPLSVPVTT